MTVSLGRSASSLRPIVPAASAVAGAIVLYAVLLLLGYSTGRATVPLFVHGDPRVAADGFYDTERAGDSNWTWTRPHATLAIHDLERDVPWTFTAHLAWMRPPDAPSPRVRVTIDDRTVSQTAVNPSGGDLAATIPAGSGRGVTIGIDVTPAFAPGAADTRMLGVAVESMSLRRAGTLAWPPPSALVGGSIALVALAALLLIAGVPVIWGAAVLGVAAAAQAWLLTRAVLLYAPYPSAAVAPYVALAAAVILVVATRRRTIGEGVDAATDTSMPLVASRSLWRRSAVIAGVALAYAAACRIMLAPVFNFAALSTASYEGDARVFIWVYAWDNHAVLDRAGSLFNANVLYPLPHSLAYFEHMFGISLFTLPVYAATRNPVLAYNVVWIASFMTTAAAVHLLAWRHTRDHLASIVAGMSFTFCFFRMQHAHHLNLNWCAFIPLSFIAVERWVERPTWARLATVVVLVVLQALSGWYEAILIAVALALFAAWLFVAERRTIPLRRFVAQAAVAPVAAIVVVWPFARHYFGLHEAPPAYAGGASADLVAWFVPPENTFAGQWLLGHGIKGPRPIWGEVTVYLGWVTVLLALAGAALTIRTTRIRPSAFFVLLALVAGAFAVGPSAIEIATGSFGSSPFGLLSNIPGFSLFRNPARYTQLLSLALAVLAAVAAAAAHRRFGIAARIASVAAIGLLLVEVYVVKFPAGKPQPFGVPPIYTHLAKEPPGAVLSLPDYANTPLWFQEADYQYFSTVHWHPIVNGDAREFPPVFAALKARLLTFPSAVAAAAMRDARVEYVVLHSARTSPETLAGALASPDYELVAKIDADYLFRIAPAVAALASVR